MGVSQACEHSERIAGTVCPACLRATWERAARAREDAIRIRLTRQAAVQPREQARADQQAEAAPTALLERGEPAPGRGEPGLPPLDYRLPPLDEARNALSYRWLGMPVPVVRSKLYAWGYEPAQSRLLLEQGTATGEAQEFAAARGWDGARSGAWAVELAFPTGLSQALGSAGGTLHSDPGACGWGGRTVRPHERHCRPLVPLARLRAAVGDACETAGTLRRRAGTILDSVAASAARQRRLMEQVREARLERLKKLPAAEFSRLNQTLTAVHDLADAGRLAEGYSLLLESWDQAAADAAQGVPWSGLRRWIYGVSLDNYVWRYGPSLDDRP